VAAVVVVVLIAVALVVASGGSDDEDEEVVGPNPTVTTTRVVDRPQIPAETLYSVPGYTFTELPSGTLEVARSPFDSVPELEGMLIDLSGRSVVRNGSPVGGALVYQFTSRFTSIPEHTEDFFAGFTGLAAESEDITVDGHPGVYYEVGRTTLVGVVVLKGNVAVLVQGPPSTPRSRLEQVASGLLQNVP
jgi:hypothetical protein